MNRFMIGQFDVFDFAKQDRDYRKNFFGIEVCHMNTVEELQVTLDYVQKENIHVGFHFPVLNNQWKYRDPQYMSLDQDVKYESLNYMKQEFERAKPFKPAYILTHFPKPVILNTDVDWSCWRFADRSEYYFSNEYEESRFVKESRAFFKWLSEEGLKNNFTPILELDAVNHYIYDSDLLPELLDKYPNIRICLDIGRIHLQDMIDENFSGYDFVRNLAPYTDLVHLWNVKVDVNVENGHFPALPTLSHEEGWADVEKYFSILKKHGQNYKVLFEHKSHLITDEELQACYDWIERLL